MKTLIKAIIVLFSIFFLIFNTQNVRSQNFPIKIQLHQPPSNTLNASYLWKATLNNSSGKSMNIFLEGYADEEKDGRIVEGKTNIFVMPAGSRDYKYEDFKKGTINWIIKKYEEILLRTENAPAGTYTICMTAKNEMDEIVAIENCCVQTIVTPTVQEINLISPEDHAQIKDENPVFSWTPQVPLPKERFNYELKIVEIVGNQSPKNAIKDRNIFYSNKDISTTQFQYPIFAPKFNKGKKYAWNIIVNGQETDVYSFDFIKQEKTITNEILGANCSSTTLPWLIGGNILQSQPYYLGTCDNNPLVLGTSGNERIRILTNGKFGIGTSNPKELFHVLGGGVRFSPYSPKNITINGWDIGSNGGITINAHNDNNSSHIPLNFAASIFNFYTGNVGIGTNSPADKLEVNGNISVTGLGPNGISTISGRKNSGMFNLISGSWGSSIELYGQNNSNNGGNVRLISVGKQTVVKPDIGNILFTNFNGTNWIDNMIIKSNGNVGIGTNYPTKNLQIEKKKSFNCDATLRLADFHYLGEILVGEEGDPEVLYPPNYHSVWDIVNLDGVLSFNFGFSDNPWPTTSSMLTIRTNGNVLIGKTTQYNYNYKLDVNGKVRANEIVVNTTGADFVFDEKYELINLNDLEKSIKINKHLPGVPNAEEMQKNGIGLGEMNTILLQKVEELTLYIIDLKKLIEKQNEQITAIEKIK